MAVDNIARGMAAEALSGGGGGGSSTLSGLTDVDISNPTNGQTLVYNATSGKWENGGSAGGGVLVVETSFDDSTGGFTCNKTWEEINQAPFAVIVVDFSGIGAFDTQIVRYIVTETVIVDNNYIISSIYGESEGGAYVNNMSWIANSANGYPVYVL